ALLFQLSPVVSRPPHAGGWQIDCTRHLQWSSAPSYVRAAQFRWLLNRRPLRKTQTPRPPHNPARLILGWHNLRLALVTGVAHWPPTNAKSHRYARYAPM